MLILPIKKYNFPNLRHFVLIKKRKTQRKSIIHVKLSTKKAGENHRLLVRFILL